MYGIGKGNMSLAPWRSLFLICGGLTSATGLLFIFLMPRDTTTAWFLSPQEREVATQRMAIDRATRDHAVFSKAQLKEALLSPMTWIYCLMGICITLTTPIMKVCQPSSSGIRRSGINPHSSHSKVQLHRHTRLRLLNIQNDARRNTCRSFQLHYRLDRRHHPSRYTRNTSLHRHRSLYRPAPRINIAHDAAIFRRCRLGNSGSDLARRMQLFLDK